MYQCQHAMSVQKGNKCTNHSSSAIGFVKVKRKGKKVRNSFQCANDTTVGH